MKLHYCNGGDEEAVRILKRNRSIDGIFSCADSRFRNIFKIMPELGRDPGRDLAMVGFYHTPWSEMFSPTLTSVDIFPEKIVDEVIRMYFERGKLKTFVKKIRPKLVIGESTKNFRSQPKRK